ncbi:ribulokinase [Virgibacillus sp. 179-BFC.A HS]|uniref:Ribulokinase n=1 Tax=Tigheibacillus jepli TaxID=3035914 RepID=A0ABU5CE94_9BACI|nr:ribulokinase [Virgibacillus sp. 179-BFC.A HS]MDY0404638.1 ribulokinase [Virgibacillus sp. 179-BFC.A HS]
MMEKYSIGIDFGTESGRVLIIHTATGHIAASSVIPYKHGVITEKLPSDENTKLPKDFALQHPQDYLDVIYQGIPLAMEKARISKEAIVGIGVDFTSSTVLPVDNALRPLCFQKKWQNNPHAWVKLWKHHSPKKETDEIMKKAVSKKYNWLRKYGFNISTEWFIPKCLETLNAAPEVFEAADMFLEAGDWVVSQLTNEVVRSNCSLGFKAFWNEDEGFPKLFFSELSDSFTDITKTKLRGRIGKIGETAGYLSKEAAEKTGMPEKLPVAVAIIDAHAALLGVGAAASNQLTMIMGTSTCHIMLHEKEIEIPGISGVVKDAIIPGLYAYEAGQSAVGDLFGWFAKQVPNTFLSDANRMGISVFDLLEKRAARLQPGESGLLAMDWHNGNRSVLSDSDLSGLIMGLTLQTKPEEIYRAYMEATAFGAKIILETTTRGDYQFKRFLQQVGCHKKPAAYPNLR